MENTAPKAPTSQVEDRAAHLIDRAFVTAHLLTASVQQAEDAVTKALDCWNPHEDEEALFQNILDGAAQVQSQANSPGSELSGSYLPGELRAVLRLAPDLRRCFVLRILAGLSPQGCARLLQLHLDRVEEYTCAALQTLGARDLNPGIQYAG